MAMSTCSSWQNASRSATSRIVRPSPKLTPTLRCGGVEHADQVETLLGEAPIAGQRRAQRAGADDDHVPRALQAQTALDLVDQPVDLVAHAARAELAEVREVLADLRGVKVDQLGELL